LGGISFPLKIQTVRSIAKAAGIYQDRSAEKDWKMEVVEEKKGIDRKKRAAIFNRKVKYDERFS
jgi:hypothetical protein